MSGIRRLAGILFVVSALFAVCPAHASPSPLPSGLGWGMSEAECKECALSAGYTAVAPVVPERSEDRVLRKSAMMSGIREASFSRKNPDSVETLRVHLYRDALFRVTVTFRDFASGFGGKVVSRLADELASAPRYTRGQNSGMEVYLWERGTTGVQFGYREIPRLPLFFAEISYFHLPVWGELKRNGIQ